MRWPWQHRTPAGRLAVQSGSDRFAFALADEAGRLRAAGVIAGPRQAQDLARQVRALNLPGQGAVAVLPLTDAQLLPVEAPAVKPEELKAAARWRIKDLVDERLEELTIDVMHVGDDRPRPNRQVFVAAARRIAAQVAGVRFVAPLVNQQTRTLFEAALRREGGVAVPLLIGGKIVGGIVMRYVKSALTASQVHEIFVPALKRLAQEIAVSCESRSRGVPALADTDDSWVSPNNWPGPFPETRRTGS